MAYAASGMEPPVPVPLRESDPRQVGPYRTVSVLGHGGMGRVYLGRDTTGGRGMAAVKVIRPEYAEDPKFRKRFEREAGALGRVQSAHTARLLGSGFDGDLVWVATEYIPGPTLSQAIDACGPIDAGAAWRLTADLGRAIEAMWRAGIVHRDLKPSNVILAADGARLIDFGVIQAADSSSITTTGQYVGTAAFMSPEQARGRQLTAASDIFSLASTLTYALVGKAPFGEGTGVDVMHRVAFEPPQDEILDVVAAADPNLAAFIRTCLDKDPEQRPTPETVFTTAIGHQLSGPAPLSPQAGAPATPAASATPPSRKRRNILIGAAVAVAVLAAAGTSVALLNPGSDGPAAAAGPSVSPAATTNATASSAPSPTAAPTSVPTAPPTSADAPETTTDANDANDAIATNPDLRSASCPAKIVSGAEGTCVSALQRLLVGYGLHIVVDGQFGDQTLGAVKVFQTEAGIIVDGIVGDQTKKSLYDRPGGPLRTGALTVTQSVDATDVARCLDADTATTGRTIRVWDCTGADNQKWALYPVPGRDSEFTLVNQSSHLCLDADAGTTGQNGQLIQGRSCDGLSAQRWTLGTTAPSGGRTLVSVPDGFCLDADAATTGQNGQKVQGYGCAGSVNQFWQWA